MSGAGLVGIFAAGRNGSTLLMRLLDGSPDLWVHPVEVAYLSVFSDLSRYGRVRRYTAQNATTEKPLALDDAVSTELLIRSFSQHEDDLRNTYLPQLREPLSPRSDPFAMMRTRPAHRADEFLLGFLEAVREAYDARTDLEPRWTVFKSIETPYIQEYARTFPSMRFIHIVRYPIPNYASLKRTNMVVKNWPFWRHGGDQLRMFLEARWLPHARTLVDVVTRHDDRHFVLRYEDLTADPQRGIRECCEWLGAAQPPDPTQQTVLGGREMGVLPFNPSKRGIATPQTVVRNMTETFAYDDVLTSREKEFILARTRPWAERLGYPITDCDMSLPARARLAARWLGLDTWDVRNVRSLRALPALVPALLRRRAYVWRALLFGSA